MPMVPPGSETGVYVMPIGNLPWNVTWQELKDFARDPKDGKGLCDIEHAEVYTSVRNSKLRSSGHGYIKVRGDADFWRVYHYLLGREWKGLCLQPDSRNAWTSIPVGDAQIGTRTATELHGSSTASSRRPLTSMEFVSSSSTWQTQSITDEAAPVRSQVYLNWNRAYDEVNTQMQPPRYTYQEHVAPSQPYPHYSTMGNIQNEAIPQHPPCPPPSFVYLPIPADSHYTYMNPNIPQRMGCYQAAYTPAYPHGAEIQAIDPQLSFPIPNMPLQASAADQQLSSYMSNMTIQSLQEPMIETEARKIHIGNLPSHFRTEDLKKHLAFYATIPPGQDDDAVESLESPMQHDSSSSSKASTRRRRSHAFAILKDSEMALNCIEALDGSNFKGKRLELKLTKEGVARPRVGDAQYLVPPVPVRSAAESSRGHHGSHGSGSSARGSPSSGSISGRSSQASGAGSGSNAGAAVVHRAQTPMVVDSSSARCA